MAALSSAKGSSIHPVNLASAGASDSHQIRVNRPPHNADVIGRPLHWTCSSLGYEPEATPIEAAAKYIQAFQADLRNVIIVQKGLSEARKNSLYAAGDGAAASGEKMQLAKTGGGRQRSRSHYRHGCLGG